MAGKNTAVFGIYKTVVQAEAAAGMLTSAGFSSSDISVLLPDSQGGVREFAHEKNTKAPEGTSGGAVAGGALGGTLGLLAGIGALAIPGVGPLIAAGPSEAWLEGWSGSAFRSTRPSGTKVVSRTAGSCSRYTATPRTK